MAMQETFEIDGVPAEGYVVPLGTCNLVFAKKGNSLLACGAIDIAALEKLNVAAAKVTGVATLAELLDGQVQAVNQSAARQGATVGQTGREALARMG